MHRQQRITNIKYIIMFQTVYRHIRIKSRVAVRIHRLQHLISGQNVLAFCGKMAAKGMFYNRSLFNQHNVSYFTFFH